MKKENKPSEETITRAPLTGSKKIYVKGKIHDINVAMREIQLTESKPMFAEGEFKKEMNPAVTVYDTSGPYTDPNVEIDIKKGLPRLREQWILDRGDVERLDEVSSQYGMERKNDPKLDELRFEHIQKPLRAKAGKKCDTIALCQTGNHYT